jgi:hypothetical protein
MVRFHEQIQEQIHEQILQNNLHQIRDLTWPSSVRASLLAQIEEVQRNRERARSLGCVLPEELQILEVLR